MAYNIQYSQQYQVKYPVKKKAYISHKFLLIMLLILCAGFLVYKLKKHGILGELLVPGDADITMAAVEKLLDNLKLGTPVSEALTAFCTEILGHASVF